MPNWICKRFEELAPKELYAVLKLRNEVFVIEQNCVYQDADGKDESCFHLLGYVDNNLAAYARLVPAKAAFAEISIGRVVTSPAYRNVGAGRQLMHKAIEQCCELFGKQPIRIGAQLYMVLLSVSLLCEHLCQLIICYCGIEQTQLYLMN